MQEMMHCLINPSVLERQRALLSKNLSFENFFSLQCEGLGDDWPNLNPSPTSTVTTSTVSNSTPSVQVSSDKCSKKRKADKSPLVASADEKRRMMGNNHENEVKKKQRNKGEDDGNNSDSKEDTNDKKPDFIHVRARRGQATDSHSLAERVRRERISERMKYLQGLVPGCDKITGKAGMLDEIINYVQSLQRQVEFLSMKLATVNPRLDFNLENNFPKEMNLTYNSNMSSIGMPSELTDPNFFQFNAIQQAVASCGLNLVMNPAELAQFSTARSSASSPVPASEPSLDSCFNVQRSNAGWDNDYLLNLHAFPFQSLQGNILPNLKREM